MIVVDPSLVVAALVRGGAPARRLASTDVAAPHALDAHVTDALARQVAAGRLSGALAVRALDVLARLVVDRFDHAALLPRAWALRGALPAAPAMCVALAEALEVPLVSCDARVAAVPGLATTVEVVPA